MQLLEKYFKALGDVSRLRIVNLLLHGELCVCDIQFVLQASQSNVSRHLAYLKNSGLALDRRDGYRVFYRLMEPRKGLTKALFGFLHEVYRNEALLEEDNRRLREAVRLGSCTLSEWKPYSAVGAVRSAGRTRA